MILAWVNSIQQHGAKQLRGRRVWAYMLPILLAIMYAIEYCAVPPATYDLDPIIRFISDTKYYADPIFFEVWHLWSYILYHDDILQIALIALFGFPVLTYWERVFGQSYMLVAILILAPACIAGYIIIGMSPAQPGCSLLIPALYGAFVFQGHKFYARCTMLTLWGSRLGLRHPHCLPIWPALIFVLFEGARLWYVGPDWWTPVIFLGGSVVALMIGSSVFTVVGLLAGKSSLVVSEDVPLN